MEAIDLLDQYEQLPEQVQEIFFNEFTNQQQVDEALNKLALLGYKAEQEMGLFSITSLQKLSTEEHIEELVKLNLAGIDIIPAIKNLTKQEKDKAILYLKFSHSGEYLEVLRLINLTI